MSTEITVAFTKQFTEGVSLLQQQMLANIRQGVSMAPHVVGDRAFFDQVDATAMSQITTRHGDTTITDTPHRRRMVTMTPFEVADLLDRSDQIRTLNDPTNAYVKSFAAAANRQQDDTIIAAFDASASTGVDGGTSVNFPGGDFDDTANTNMTLARLQATRTTLEAAENMEDEDEHRWYIVLAAANRERLLDTTEVTSSDYNTVKALVNGQLDSFYGFRFLKSQRLTLSGTVRTCFAWEKSSMKLAVGAEPRGFIDVLPGKRHSTQIRWEMDLGATRMNEKGVVRMVNDEAL